MRTLKMAVHAGNPGPYVHKVINKLVDRLHTAKNWLVRPEARAICGRWSTRAAAVGPSCAWQHHLLQSQRLLPQPSVLLPVQMAVKALGAAAAAILLLCRRMHRGTCPLIHLPLMQFPEPVAHSAQTSARLWPVPT